MTCYTGFAQPRQSTYGLPTFASSNSYQPSSSWGCRPATYCPPIGRSLYGRPVYVNPQRSYFSHMPSYQSYPVRSSYINSYSCEPRTDTACAVGALGLTLFASALLGIF
jgi:hypothetical protein